MNKTCVIYSYAIGAEVDRLTDLAQGHGWTVTETVTEAPTTPPNQRVGMRSVRRIVEAGHATALVLPSILFLGGSLGEAVALISWLSASNVALVAVSEGIDTTQPLGAAWLAAVAPLAEYQKAIRLESARAGQRRARASGTHCGRPPLGPAVVERIRNSLRVSNGTRPTARKLNVSPSRVALEKQAMIAEQGSAQ